MAEKEQTAAGENAPARPRLLELGPQHPLLLGALHMAFLEGVLRLEKAAAFNLGRESASE